MAAFEIVLEHIRCRKESFGFASVFDELRTAAASLPYAFCRKPVSGRPTPVSAGASASASSFHSCNDFFLCLRHFYRLIFRFVHFRCYVFCYVLFRLESFFESPSCYLF